jgi:DNA-directed RNA polymerase I subunit RPA2
MHQELHKSALFSFAGNLIPFPDHNQSPRNVYQCKLGYLFKFYDRLNFLLELGQMGKQTMGTAVHAWKYRADNKMYNLQVHF